MFSYCLNNPVGYSDATGRLPTKSDILGNQFMSYGGYGPYTGYAYFPAPKFIEKPTEAQPGTTALGVGIGGYYGGGGSYSVAITYDNLGNVGIMGTIEYGGGTPTGGITVSHSTTNAPNIYQQEGPGLTGGAAIALGPTPISVGGDYNILLTATWEPAYHGYTRTVGVGIGLPAECHGTITDSTIWWSFNIYDVLNEVFSLAGK